MDHLKLIGNTPIIQLHSIKNANVFAKLEYFNPSHSMKDRVAIAMIEDAEKSGKINKDTILVEPTSGNMGISLAFVCKIKKYKLILVMPENMSIERRKMANLYGAEVILTPPELGFSGAIAKAKEISAKPNHLNLNQYDNEANFMAHKKTGEEIYKQMPNIDILIAGIGTGGFLSGCSSYIKSKNPNFKAIAIEPEDNNILQGGTKFQTHIIQGIGPNFVPQNFKNEYIDGVHNVTKSQVLEGLKILNDNAIAGGISSGACSYLASKMADDNPGKNILFIVASFAERYLSTDII